MKIMTKLCTALILLVTASAYCEKENYTCFKKNAEGTCVREEYYEDGFWVATCTAPATGKCSTKIARGNKTASCSIENGATCYAKVRAPK